MNNKMTAAEYAAIPWMHIHAQFEAHDQVRILGNREALVALRDAINLALVDKNGEAEAKGMTGDGEGYGVMIRRLPGSAVRRSRLPYIYFAYHRL